MGGFKFTCTVGMGIGKRAFFMAEQFAFEQGFGNGTHIHRYHIPSVSVRQSVYFPCQHFFSCAVLSCNQNIGIRLRHFLYQRPQLLHGIAFSPIHRRYGFRDFRSLLVLGGIAAGRQQGFYQPGIVPRLDDEVCCSFLDAAHCQVYVSIGCEKYYGQGGVYFLYLV